jgi:protein-tyrosine-phosphatase
VPVLATLLEDEKLAHMARYALEPIKDPSVDETFRASLKEIKRTIARWCNRQYRS